MTLPHAFYYVFDYVFPLAEPLSREERERPQKRLMEDKAAIPLLVSGPGESRSTFLHRRVECTLEVLSDHDTQNNRKLTQMKIAHRAMKNFLGGVLVFTVLAAVFGTKEDSRNEFIDALKKNHELNELLKGPQGPPGVAGPKGDAAPTPPAKLPPCKCDN